MKSGIILALGGLAFLVGCGDMGDTASKAPAPAKPAKGPAAFFTADLTGAQEVPVAGGPAVGAPNGKASAVVEIKGDRVTFGFTWSGISAPTLGHIHEGVTGKNGAVKVGLFTTAMPDTVNAAAGQVTVTDAALAQSLRTNPTSTCTPRSSPAARCAAS